MNKSTSMHGLNADRGLNIAVKPFYLILNWVNNLFPYFRVDKRMEIKQFNPEWEKLWDRTYQSSSPSRKISDMFWYSLPWERIEDEIGKIHIFDTGCGSGNYGARLYESSGGKVASYTGVDAKERPNWKDLSEKYPNFNFIQSSSSDISKLIPVATNLFITQSAIEHFEDDLYFFEQIRNFIERRNLPIIQIHLFPAAAALPLYLFHGVRQYTPRNISKITRMFGDSSKFTLYGLGGREGKKVHFKYFTWPVLIIRKYVKPTFDVDEYNKQLRKAFQKDSAVTDKSPLFWALIIQSNTKAKIW